LLFFAGSNMVQTFFVIELMNLAKWQYRPWV
jgi:hypothetical protein